MLGTATPTDRGKVLSGQWHGRGRKKEKEKGKGGLNSPAGADFLAFLVPSAGNRKDKYVWRSEGYDGDGRQVSTWSCSA